MEQVADEQMVRNAFGDDYDELAEPPRTEGSREHPLWGAVIKALREIYDPEIPVNIYELGLIYSVHITDAEDGTSDVDVKMTLTSPGCPVAQEMPGMVQSAIFPLTGVGQVDVEIIWEPAWDPSFMAETAKLQLNMFM
ncbi:MAG TPA: iron-sulfur cluster assembly protein [Alphaproteobacteria bacterium]|nr:iron-sulfur cluster assembly protein [Alphaproteobacteria bacterium]HNS44835.1 iron-sulfur cluster assembly protein [Alphaproteobacteria bacterium]